MSNKNGLIIGVVTFSILLVLSAAFYKERTVFLDISFHLFSILKDGGFAIQNNRFGSFFTQLFPLVGSKLGFSLKALAIAYSMSFVILPFITFLIIQLILKNTRVSVAYLLFSIIMTTHTFYWIQSELPQAIAFLFIFIALWDNHKQDQSIPPRSLFLWSILLFTICFTHPLMLIIFTFVLTYYYISDPGKRGITTSIGFTFYAFYIIKSLFFRTPYDSQAMSGLKNILTLLPTFYELQSTKNLLTYFIFDYYFLALLLIATLVYFIRQKKYLESLLIFGFFFGYCLLVNVSYPNGADQFYIENLYLVLAVIVALPFVFEVLPRISNPNIQIGVISLICLLGIIRIINTQSIYSDRLSWYREVITDTEDLPNKKIIIPVSEVPQDKLMMTWGSSYEFWLLSTIESGESRSIIIEEIPDEYNWALPGNNAFITKWGAFDYANLNSKYFIFRDSTGYMKLE